MSSSVAELDPLARRGRGVTPIPFTRHAALAWSIDGAVLTLASAECAVMLREGEAVSDFALLRLVGSGAPLYTNEAQAPRALAALRDALEGPLAAFAVSRDSERVLEAERRHREVERSLLRGRERARERAERALQERAERVEAGLPALDSVRGRQMPPRDAAPSNAEAVAGAREAARVELLAIEAAELADLASEVELVALPELPSVAGLRVAEVLPELLLLASAETVAKGGCVVVAVVGGVVGVTESRRELLDVSEDDALARWVDRIAEERRLPWASVARALLVACRELGVQLGRGLA